jgi:hypothetical protein
MAARFLLALSVLLAAAPAGAQSGLSLPRGDTGLDPTLAPNWQSFDYSLHRFTTGQRPSWSWPLTQRGSLGMSYNGNGRDLDFDGRQMSLFGRYSLDSNWAFSAETQLRDPGNLPRLQDLRIGVQRRF